MNVDFLIPSGGVGKRAKTAIPKQFIENRKGISPLEQVVDVILQYKTKENIEGQVIIVLSKDARFEAIKRLEKNKDVFLIYEAGNTREETVYNGLKYVNADFVLIHDAARPYLSYMVINNVINGLLQKKESVVPVIPMRDTVIDENGNILNREKIKIIQTPQGFVTKSLKKWMENVKDKLNDFTDESTIGLHHGVVPFFVEGDIKNKKITYLFDTEEWMNEDNNNNIRIGYGYDIHRFGGNKPLILGGVEVPFDKGLVAHSDGDVLIHALMDALLGAVGLRDIGVLFPNNESKWKDASSIEMLKIVMDKINAEIFNADITVRAEKPHLSKYIPSMVKNISAILKAPVSIKATTDEQIGHIGKGEGIAVHAVVLIKMRG